MELADEVRMAQIISLLQAQIDELNKRFDALETFVDETLEILVCDSPDDWYDEDFDDEIE